MIEIIIPGEPCGKGRPKIGRSKSGFSIAYTPEKTRTREGIIASIAIEAMKGKDPLEGPLYVKVVFIMPIRDSWTKKKKELALAGNLLPTGKPDLDNALKLLFDALNGIVYQDDSQICGIKAGKIYGQFAKTICNIDDIQHK